MKTKFEVDDVVLLNDVECSIVAIQAYAFADKELISYKLEDIQGWIYEENLKVIE